MPTLTNFFNLHCESPTSPRKSDYSDARIIGSSLRVFLVSFLICLVCSPVFAESQESLNKNIEKADFSLQVIRNNWRIFQRKKEKDVQKTIEKYNKIIAKGGDDAAIAKLHLADLYSPRSPQYMRNEQECARLTNEAYNEIPSQYPHHRNLASYNKGLNFYKGYGVTQNLDSALYYFEEAALAEDLLDTGLAEMYLLGIGVEQDIPGSIIMLDKGARQGNANNYPLLYAAQYIDQKKSDGTLDQEAFDLWKEGVFLYELDPDRALELYKKASERGFAPAQFEVGTHYMLNNVYPMLGNGDRDPRTYEEGIPYLEAADAQGYLPATNNLGTFLEFKDAKRTLGMVTARNPEYENQAYMLWKKAADQGFPESQVAVGIYHMYGYGPADKNYDTAYTYFSAAAKQGSQRGAEMMKNLEEVVEKERRMAIAESFNNFSNALLGFNHALSKVVRKARPAAKVKTETLNQNGDADQSSSPDKDTKKKKYSDATVTTGRLAYNEARRLLEHYKSGYFECTPDEIKDAQKTMRDLRTQFEATGQWHWGVHPIEKWDGKVDD